MDCTKCAHTYGGQSKHYMPFWWWGGGEGRGGGGGYKNVICSFSLKSEWVPDKMALHDFFYCKDSDQTVRMHMRVWNFVGCRFS